MDLVILYLAITNVDWSYAVVRIWFLRLLTNRPVYYDCRLPDDLEVSRKNLPEIPGTCGLGAGWNQRPLLSGSLADLGECLDEENEVELCKKGFCIYRQGVNLGVDYGWVMRVVFIEFCGILSSIKEIILQLFYEAAHI